MTWIDHARDMLYGALVMGCFVAGLFFLRFWKKSRDRLFALFAAAFWMLAISWIPLAFVAADFESRELIYVVRLAAFLVILYAIIDKNRSPPQA